LSRLRGLATFVALGSASALGPATMDMNLPALPAIAARFQVAVSATQLMLTMFLVGMALGQMLFGPMSDALGRRRALVFGLVLYGVASLLCAKAPSIEALVATRLLQGIGGSAAIVTARAVVRDLYDGARAAAYLSRLTLVVALAPVIAPTIGAQVLRATSWRGIFWVLAALGVLIIPAVLLFVPESLPAERRRPAHIVGLLRSFGDLLHERNFLGLTLTLAFANMTVTIYIAGSPFVLHERYGLSPAALGVVFGVNAVGLIAGSQANAALVRRIPVQRVLATATLVSVGVSCLLVALALHGVGLGPVVACFFISFAMWGFTASNAIALAMADHASAAGSAAALLGLAQWGISGLVAPLVGLNGGRALIPLAVAMLVASSVAAAALRLIAVVPTRRLLADPAAPD
jgi:MFS transporter, DHA1 family, multidrug resistance protein